MLFYMVVLIYCVIFYKRECYYESCCLLHCILTHVIRIGINCSSSLCYNLYVLTTLLFVIYNKWPFQFKICVWLFYWGTLYSSTIKQSTTLTLKAFQESDINGFMIILFKSTSLELYHCYIHIFHSSNWESINI